MKTRNGILALCVAVGGMCLILLISGLRQFDDFTMTQSDVQNVLNNYVGVEQNGVTLTELRVEFREAVASISVSVKGRKWGKGFTASAVSVGTPSFDSNTGEFHFRPDENGFNIESVEVDGDSVAEVTDRVIDLASKITSLADRAKENSDELSQLAEDKFHTLVEDTAIWALNRNAVYTLPNDWKGNAVRMALQGVTVNEGSITAHMSFLQFTKWILFYAFVVLSSIVTAFAFLFMAGTRN